jgi:hypothetical protein
MPSISPSSFRKHTEQEIAAAVKYHVLLLDTNFVMHEAFESFLNEYRDDLRNNHLLLPTVVVGKLGNILRTELENSDVLAKAKYALRLLGQAQKDKLLEIRGDKIDGQNLNSREEAGAVIVSVTAMYLKKKPVMVLTFDMKTAETLRDIKAGDSHASKDLIVAGILQTGCLVEHFFPQASTSPPGIEPFALSTTLEKNLDTHLEVREKLVAGKTVFLGNGTKLMLGKELGSGGEGVIYEIDAQDIVCKIYRDDKLNDGKRRKIELMQTRKISNPAICWIRDAVYDVDGVFRGFTMPRVPAGAKSLGASLFIPKTFIENNPHWSRVNSTTLALNIVKTIDYLHSLNILIGDLNPQNILFGDENEVYFVDCDSFQVEGFPCPVGTINFTAPEIHRREREEDRDFKNFLRTKDNELFAVATLLFMIFLPGKTPFSHVGGENVRDNIKKGHFPYPYGKRLQKGAPLGRWRFCWSHLDWGLKGEFNRSFHFDQRGNGPVTLKEWKDALEKYLDDLNRFGYQGPAMKVGFDLSIMPRNVKRLEENGEIRPPFRTDGKTDFAAEKDRVISDWEHDGQRTTVSNFSDDQ